MSIMYYNNCWFTNVGEAFIDIGAMNLIKKIFPNERIINFSRMNKFYLRGIVDEKKNKEVKELNMWEYIGGEDVKYVVLSGMFACEEYVSSLENDDFIQALLGRGVKLIYLGLGQSIYSAKETTIFRGYLEKVKPALIVSRDDKTYQNFKDVIPSIRGMDCAFWVKDSYDPSKCKTLKKYDVLSYNRSEESERAINMIGETFIRMQHMQYWCCRDENGIKDNMLISDTPYDYLTCYAFADRVFTDLVHATIISLQYGKHVLFEGVDNRKTVIESIDDLEVDQDGLIYIKEQHLEKNKNAIVSQIKEFLEKQT